MGLAHKMGSIHVNASYGRSVRNMNAIGLLIRADKLKGSCVPEDVARAADCFYVLGFIYTNYGEKEEARVYFERVLQLRPQYNPSLEGFGSASVSHSQKRGKEELLDLMKDRSSRVRVENLFLDFATSWREHAH